MTVGSLFSGIGGLDLGLERAGMRVIWQSEIDPYASAVLRKHWPEVPNLGDVTTIDWSEVERPDLVCGGFPCQPFSAAGKRLADNDPRNLWPETIRALRGVRPDIALLENVPGLLDSGYLWQIAADLAEYLRGEGGGHWQGFPLSAISLGAKHTRERLFIVAYTERVGNYEPLEVGRISSGGDVAPTIGSEDWASFELVAGPLAPEKWKLARPDFDPRPLLVRNDDGVPHRVDRLRCLGNAVVPQVAEWIGRRIMEAVR